MKSKCNRLSLIIRTCIKKILLWKWKLILKENSYCHFKEKRPGSRFKVSSDVLTSEINILIWSRTQTLTELDKVKQRSYLIKAWNTIQGHSEGSCALASSWSAFTVSLSETPPFSLLVTSWYDHKTPYLPNVWYTCRRHKKRFTKVRM